MSGTTWTARPCLSRRVGRTGERRRASAKSETRPSRRRPSGSRCVRAQTAPGQPLKTHEAPARRRTTAAGAEAATADRRSQDCVRPRGKAGHPNPGESIPERAAGARVRPCRCRRGRLQTRPLPRRACAADPPSPPPSRAGRQPPGGPRQTLQTLPRARDQCSHPTTTLPRSRPPSCTRGPASAQRPPRPATTARNAAAGSAIVLSAATRQAAR
jgi:hypothetical protein